MTFIIRAFMIRGFVILGQHFYELNLLLFKRKHVFADSVFAALFEEEASTILGNKNVV